MSSSLREFVEDLHNAKQIREVHKRIDIRHIAALVDQSDTALLFASRSTPWVLITCPMAACAIKLKTINIFSIVFFMIFSMFTLMK